MNINNRVTFVGLSLLVFLTSTFCLGTLAKKQNMVGKWIETGISCERREELCATIEFFPDGTYETINFPLGLLFDDLASPRVDGTGTWEFVHNDDAPFEFLDTRYMIINTDQTPSINNYTIKLNFRRNGGALYIDPITFIKVDTE